MRKCILSNHHAISRKVADSIPDEAIGFYLNLPNNSSIIIALWLTWLLIEMSTRNLSGGRRDKAQPTRKADNFTAMCEPIVWKMWALRHLSILYTSKGCYGEILLYFALEQFFLSHYTVCNNRIRVLSVYLESLCIIWICICFFFKRFDNWIWMWRSRTINQHGGRKHNTIIVINGQLTISTTSGEAHV
jgi:hypothetical protein